MKKILFMVCMAGLFMSSCEKDPDMGKLDADLVVYTYHDNNTDFTAFILISFLVVYWKQMEFGLHIGKMRMRR